MSIQRKNKVLETQSTYNGFYLKLELPMKVANFRHHKHFLYKENVSRFIMKFPFMINPFLHPETACSWPFPHLGIVRHQSLIIYNREACIISCMFLGLFSATKGNQYIFRSTTPQSAEFTFSFCTMWHMKTCASLKNNVLFQLSIHIYSQQSSKSDAQVSQWNVSFPFLEAGG